MDSDLHLSATRTFMLSDPKYVRLGLSIERVMQELRKQMYDGIFSGVEEQVDAWSKGTPWKCSPLDQPSRQTTAFRTGRVRLHKDGSHWTNHRTHNGIWFSQQSWGRQDFDQWIGIEYPHAPDIGPVEKNLRALTPLAGYELHFRSPGHHAVFRPTRKQWAMECMCMTDEERALLVQRYVDHMIQLAKLIDRTDAL